MTNNGNVLLEGTIVELRAPDLENEILKGDWHSWFNDSKITRFLEHGLYPNTREKQYKFIANELTNDSNLILSIYEKKTNRHIGVISLKNIDFINSNAEIAIVMGVSNIAGSAIEAMALLTEHGFNRLNLQKLYTGQHESLWKWVNVLRTIGFKVEGLNQINAKVSMKDTMLYLLELVKMIIIGYLMKGEEVSFVMILLNILKLEVR